MQIQPSEFAKYAVVIFTASQLARKSHLLHLPRVALLTPFLAPLPALALLLLQPDFGTVMLIVVTIVALLLVAGVPLRYLLAMCGTVAGIGAALVWTSPYRKMRVLGFLDPWGDPGGKGFQILQSLLGLQNGELLGVGLGASREKLFYLPEAHNDFIFAVIGEELGFVGVVSVLVAYLYISGVGFRIAWHAYARSRDLFVLLLGVAVTCMIGMRAFVNIAVVMGMLPTKGLTLPFVSAGGTALIVDLAAVGILSSIARSKRV